MPDRTVSYEFRAKYAQFTAGLGAMGKSVSDTSAKLTALDKNGQRMRSGLTAVGNVAGGVGLVAAAGLTVAIGAAANFEQAMSNVQAATHETSENMKTLRQAALDAGQATQYSATEAAGAIEELSKAGVSTADILSGGLSGALDLAAAGGLEVADAAEIAASALVQFKLSGDEVPHVADLLAAGAGKAQGSVQDLGYALKYAGVPAASLGISIEETTGVLAEFASAGIVGEQAGTTLRSLLLSLAAPTQKANVLLDEYGITLYDSAGKFVGLESAAQQLNEKLSGLSESQRNAALNTIFGTSAIQGAIQLYEGGGKAVADWTNKVDDQGYAADTAAIKMDNLKGDVEQLTGALETAFIGAGSGGQGPLRSLVQGATEAVNAFNKLPGPIQSSVTGLAGLVAVTGGGLFFGAKVVTGIANARQAIDDLNISSGKAKKAVSALGKASVVAGGLIAAMALQTAFNPAENLPGVEELTGRLIELSKVDTSKLPAEFDTLAASIERLANPNAAQSLQDNLSNALGGIGGGKELAEARNEIEALDAALANLATTGGADKAEAAFAAVASSAGLSKTQTKELADLLPTYGDALAGAANSATLAADATDSLGTEQAQAAQAAQEQANAISEAVEAMEKQRDAAIGAFDAITGYRQAMKDATAQAKSNREGINGNSDAALKNRGALSSLAAAWNNQSATVTGNIKKFKEARSNFIETATAMGVPEKAAKQLANQLLEIPESRVVNVTTPGIDTAQTKARTLKDILDSLKSKSINIALNYQRIGDKPKAPIPGDPGGRVVVPRRAPRSLPDALQDAGLNTVAPRLGDLAARSSADALTVLARESNKAGGGLKSLRDKAERLEKAADRAERRYDKEQSKLDDLLSKQSDLTGSVAGLFNLDLGSATISQIDKAAGQANAYPGIIQALEAAGLTGQALSEVLLEMDSKQLQNLANNPALAAQYASSLNALNAAAGAAGSSAGSAVYGADVAEQTKVAKESHKELQQVNRRLNAIERAIDKREANDERRHKDKKNDSGKGDRDAGNARRRARI